MSISNITTGEQSVNSTGAVTGTLDTSALTGDFTIKLRIRGTGVTGDNTDGDIIKVAIEDTANSSAFSDALTVAVADVKGGFGPEGATFSWRDYQVPSARVGATHNKLRANVLAVSGGTFEVFAWLEQ